MGNPSYLVDTSPWDLLTTQGTVDASGNLTLTGAQTGLTKRFKVTAKTSFSLFAQATGTGVNGTGIVIQANNGFDDSRQVQLPGVWTDVTASYGVAGANTAPGVHNFKATFGGGGNDTDFFSSWVCPYAYIRFVITQASGTGVYSGQFYAGEV